MSVGVISFVIAAVVALLLTWLLVANRHRSENAHQLILPILVMAAWSLVAVYSTYDDFKHLGSVYYVAEIVRYLCWFAFIFCLLQPLVETGSNARRITRLVQPLVYLYCALLLVVDLFPLQIQKIVGFGQQTEIRLVGHSLLAILGLLATEQLISNTKVEHRWSWKFLFLGLLALFGYDLFLYTHAVLFGALDPVLWQSRGFVFALAMLMLIPYIRRTHFSSREIFISQDLVLHTVTLVATGFYLLLMALAAYLLRAFGGSWGVAIQTVFLVGAVLLLALLLFSGKLRARIRVFIQKNFYQQGYDYRKEWLRFMETLTTFDERVEPKLQALKAICDLFESTGAVLWTKNESGDYLPEVAWQTRSPANWPLIDSENSLIEFTRRTGWLVEITEYLDNPDFYTGLDLPDWIVKSDSLSVLVPLFYQNDMIGVVGLLPSRVPRQLNWEDRDLLKTAALQVANTVALLEATDKLVQARQFEAFNRLSAFVVHDLKNVNAQLSLVVTNADKHRRNPEFVDDAINTVANAVTRVESMLAHLRQGGRAGYKHQPIELTHLLKQVVEDRSVDSPGVTLMSRQHSVKVLGDREKLYSALEHLIQNAQQATESDTPVTVTLDIDEQGRMAKIEIADEGVGMSQEFIRRRLFVPFDTTKGNAGMGIGAYESKSIILGLEGSLDVQSEVGVGSLFTIRFPLMTVTEQTN